MGTRSWDNCLDFKLIGVEVTEKTGEMQTSTAARGVSKWRK